MNIEELLTQVREELTVRPSEGEVRAGVRAKVAAEVVSKQERVSSLERELDEARASLRSTEEQVQALENETTTEEVQG